MTHPTEAPIQQFRVRFLRPWGHPTKNIVCGTCDVALVSEWIANNLVRGGYAELLTHPTEAKLMEMPEGPEQ